MENQDFKTIGIMALIEDEADEGEET